MVLIIHFSIHILLPVLFVFHCMAVPETNRGAVLLGSFKSVCVAGNPWSLIATNSRVAGPRDLRRDTVV